MKRFTCPRGPERVVSKSLPVAVGYRSQSLGRTFLLHPNRETAHMPVGRRSLFFFLEKAIPAIEELYSHELIIA